MRRLGILIPAVLLLGSAVPAHALNWSLGSNLGFSSIDPSGGGDNTSVFAWPNNVIVFTPGMRVGFTGDSPQHEFFIDTGFILVSSGSNSTRYMDLIANYQYNFNTSSLSPYVTGGIGIASVGFDSGGPSISATSVQFGGGVGLRHKMGNGHGVLRGEVRYDRVNEGDDGAVVVIDELGIIGIKLGFDLWDR